MRPQASQPMTVSIIVPCYNHERYVTQCLASIDAQDCAELEVIVIDDGSKDATWQRISEYRWKPGRKVQTLRVPNGGAHAAINRGLDMASGEFLTICNSDDYFAPQRVSRLLASLKDNDSLLAFSAVRCVDNQSRDITEEWPYAQDLHRKQQEIRNYPSVGFSLVLTNVAISTGNMFFRRKLISEIGYFRPYRYCHDWDFMLRTLLVTEPVYVPDPLYFYRLHQGNSFLALQEAAAFECPELMRRFMKATMTQRFSNRLAPSPRNWPGYFEYFVEAHGYQPYQVAWEGIDGVYYAPEPTARTEAPAPANG